MLANSVNNKKEFKEWLKNHNQHLRTIGHHIRHRLDTLKEKNHFLATKIQDSYPKTSQSLAPMNTTIKVTQQLAQTKVQACDEHIKTQLEQIRKGNEIIESRMKEEAMRSKELLYKILNKDDIALKPYHEVETATEKLQQEIGCIAKEHEAIKRKSSEARENIRKEFMEIIRGIHKLQTINKELCLETSTMQSYLSDKLFAMNLKSSSSANMESSEIKKLSKDISELEAQLANYSKYD